MVVVDAATTGSVAPSTDTGADEVSEIDMAGNSALVMIANTVTQNRITRSINKTTVTMIENMSMCWRWRDGGNLPQHE